MWGAVIGDIAGSAYEGRGKKTKTKEFDFFKPHCRYTDDTVCTAAVAEILLDDLPAAATLQRWCRGHRGRGYAGRFRRWIRDANPRPYRSFGNGAAMRVSPAAFLKRERPLGDALAAPDRVTVGKYFLHMDAMERGEGPKVVLPDDPCSRRTVR